jgi:hypothetical protein
METAKNFIFRLLVSLLATAVIAYTIAFCVTDYLMDKQQSVITASLQSHTETLSSVVETSFQTNMATINSTIDNSFKTLADSQNQRIQNLSNLLTKTNENVTEVQKIYSEQLLEFEKKRGELAQNIALQIQKQGFLDERLDSITKALIRIEENLEVIQKASRTNYMVGGRDTEWRAESLDSALKAYGGAQNKLIFVGPYKATPDGYQLEPKSE